MSRKESALQALEMIQTLPPESLNGEFSDNEEYKAINAVEAIAELEAESSDSEDEETVAVLPRPFGSKENMGQSHDKNQPADNTMQMQYSPYKVRMDYFRCWLPHFNVCKIVYNSKT